MNDELRIWNERQTQMEEQANTWVNPEDGKTYLACTRCETFIRKGFFDYDLQPFCSECWKGLIALALLRERWNLRPIGRPFVL